MTNPLFESYSRVGSGDVFIDPHPHRSQKRVFSFQAAAITSFFVSCCFPVFLYLSLSFFLSFFLLESFKKSIYHPRLGFCCLILVMPLFLLPGTCSEIVTYAPALTRARQAVTSKCLRFILMCDWWATLLGLSMGQS